MPDNMLEYRKTLSRPEARHRYWHIHKDGREFFPESDKIFKVEFHGDTYELKVNHKDDVMTGKLYEKYRFLEGDSIIVRKKASGVFLLDAPDTKQYPKV